MDKIINKKELKITQLTDYIKKSVELVETEQNDRVQNYKTSMRNRNLKEKKMKNNKCL